MRPKAVFLDRDGVLTQAALREGKVSSARTLEELRFVPEARAALLDLAAGGFILFVVSNQPDVARGFMSSETLEAMNAELLAWAGESVIRAVYVCPHDDPDACECRKPQPGMIHAAARAWDVDLAGSFLVGDREVDMEAGRRAGVRTVLIDAPYNHRVSASYRAADVRDAAHWILSHAPSDSRYESVS